MKNKIMGLVVTALLAVVISTGFATVSKAATQPSVVPTGKFKMIQDKHAAGSYKKDAPNSLVQSKDGSYVLTVHNADTLTIQFKCTKGYRPALVNGSSNIREDDGSTYGKKIASNEVGLFVIGNSEYKTYVKTVSVRASKMVKVGGFYKTIYYGQAVKIKVVVRPNIAVGKYLRGREVQFIEFLNEDRVARGLNPVVQTPELQSYAETRALELFTYELSHNRPDGLEKIGCGEVIMLSSVTSNGDLDFNTFKQSSGHYTTLSQPDDTSIGIACYAYGEAVYVCADLGGSNLTEEDMFSMGE